jgi:hypothetical protein
MGKSRTSVPPLDVSPDNPILARKRGRPRKNPTGTDFQYVLQLVRLGFSDIDIVKKLDVTKRTWLRWLAENDNRERLLKARADTELGAHQALYDEAVNRRKVGALNLYLDRIESAHRGSKRPY